MFLTQNGYQALSKRILRNMTGPVTQTKKGKPISLPFFMLAY